MPTNKTIREEWKLQKTYWDTFGNLATTEIADWWLGKIDSTLLTQLQEIEDMVEGMKRYVNHGWASQEKDENYNQAIMDVIHALQEKKEELKD